MSVIEKTLNTRIVNKHGTYAEWAGSNITLKKGEIALVEFTTKQTATDENGKITVQYVPTYLMKIGDGSTPFSGLNWLSAPASDVYDWAKSASINDVDITGNQAIITLTDDLDKAEAAIVALQNAVTGGMHFIGISTTDPTTGTATVGGKAVTPATGDIVIYKVTGTDARDVEYVYDGTAWIELGDVTAEAKRITALETWRATAEDEIDALQVASHTHGNKDLLDTIVADNVHKHTNKTVIDGITATKVSNWDTAYTDSQANKGNIATQTDRIDAVYNMFGTGSELATVLILDCGTATSEW